MIEKLQQSDKNIPETLDQISPSELFQLSQECYQSPELTQSMQLKQILDWSKDTEFGRKHSFSEIETIADFQRLVPVAEWTDVEPYSDRMADGEEDILIPGKPSVFIATTGTTGYKSKLIPETTPGAIARNLVMKLRIIATNRISPGILNRGCIFPLSNILPVQKTSGGIPISYASGFTLSQSLGGQQPLKMAFPFEILAVRNTFIRDYLLMRFAIQHTDVLLIAGNNVGRMTELIRFANAHSESIIQDIENGTVAGAGTIDPVLLEKLEPALVADPNRAAGLRQIKELKGEILPRDYWPSLELMLFWLSSSVGQYINDVKPLMPNTTKYLDMGYGASEGKFNIPFEPNNPAGTLSILTAFYEFITEEGGTPLLAQQLEDQKCYELVVTTWAGLYRYNMKDVVKVQGFTGKTPNIVFQYKSNDVLNIANEKVPASQVNDVIWKMAAQNGIEPVQVQIYADLEERRYICYLESKAHCSDFDANELAGEIQQELTVYSIIYNRYCVEQKLLKPLTLIKMKNGWQDSLYAEKIKQTGSSSQVKLPVMIKEKPSTNWIR